MVRFSTVISVFVLVAGSVFAQVGANVGGTVSDNSGALVPGASVTLTNTNTGDARVLVTGPEGNYRAVNLPPSVYGITAASSGFAPVKKSVTLQVGADVTVDFTLGLAGVSESVTVEAGAALVEVAKSAPSSVVDNTQLSELPVLSRNFLVVAQTMPGAAAMQNLAVTTRFSVTKFGGVADQRSGNTTIIDGAPIDDATWGTPVINMSQDAVQEFKVFRNQFDAQYGHAMNAVVSVITRSGGDAYHGTGDYFGRDAALNARNALAVIKPDYNQTRVGGTFGGPLYWKNTHFFGGFEYLRTNTANIIALPPSNTFATQQNGNYPYTATEKIGDLKVDHNFGSKHNFYARYAYDNQLLPSGGPTNSQNTFTDYSIAHSLVTEENWIVSPTMVNTLRYTFLHHNLYTLPANYNTANTYPDYSFGQNTVDPQYFPRTNHYLQDTFFINKPKHDIKTGFELTKAFSTYQAHYYEHGVFTFTNSLPFDINNTATWPQSFVQETPGDFFAKEWYISGFVQDDWRVLPRVRLNLGLRYDFDTNLRDNKFYTSLLQNPQFTGVNNFISSNRGNQYNGWQPRFGIAWDLKGNGSVVLRGGFGKYISRNRPWFIEQAEQQTYGASVRITDPQQLKNWPNITAVLNGKSLADYVAAGNARAIYLISDDYTLPYSLNFTAGLGWKVNGRSALNVDLVHDHSLKELGTSDRNLPATGVLSAANPRPVPQFTQVAMLVNNGQARYDAVEMQYRTRLRGLESLTVSYTYSRSLIDGVTFYSTFSGTERFRQNYAYNPTDTPHNLSVAFATRDLPGKIVLSGVFRGVSGGPRTVAAGFDLDGDANISNDRPRGLPQTVGHGDVNGQLALINAFRANPCGFVYFPNVPCTAKPLGPVARDLLIPQPVIDLDLRLAKLVPFGEKRRLEVFFEGYNIANHVTAYGGTTTMTSAAFLIRTSALDARQLQWGTRFSF
jgi:hypothetical protein